MAHEVVTSRVKGGGFFDCSDTTTVNNTVNDLVPIGDPCCRKTTPITHPYGVGDARCADHTV